MNKESAEWRGLDCARKGPMGVPSANAVVAALSPLYPAHTIESGITETAVFAMPRGFGFDCRHDHCADRQWRDFRRAAEGRTSKSL